ncbi:asparaginase [Gimibacter soli]|uniref:Asparaginase n=1 Tax=Gimibacter soli TaxID=3024400 RepID=A0AAE9XRN2_9PROT|nr:asparaginase [Gimibacter soli]WCL52670.1 asparaginase [Gimibacter soli]
MTSLPHIQVFALGGTIAMTPGAASASPGVVPSLTATDLVAGVPEIAKVAHVTAETLMQVGSANLTLAHVAEVCRRAEAGSAAGYVVTQGTDSMEETAFAAFLLYEGDAPIVFTGAMRSANIPGADGAANLLAAIRVAASGGAPHVSVVMNDEIHDPARVRKSHTSSVAAFTSSGGPEGQIVEGRVFLRGPLPVRHAPMKLDAAKAQPVALLTATLDDTTALVEALPSLGYKGAVIAAYGGGHLSEPWADAAAKLAAEMPVVLATRTGAGRVLEKSYGYRGAEIDLIERGLIPSGGLDTRKARILLSLLLGSYGTEDAKARFYGFASGI